MIPLQKFIAALLGLAILAAGIMFSVILIPLVLLIGIIGFAYFYWKTRALRSAMQEARTDNSIIEGEAVVIREEPR